jgi:hypothetical protein
LLLEGSVFSSSLERALMIYRLKREDRLYRENVETEVISNGWIWEKYIN